MRCLTLVALSVALLSGHPARASVVATYDFEDGTVQGWASFDGASAPVNTTAAAFSGSRSLLTTTSALGGGGPGISLDSILLPGATYTITGELRLTSGESATFGNFTMQRSDPSCSKSTCLDTIGASQVAVSSGGWAQIGGTYTASSTEIGMLLYAQLVGPSSAVSFFLDDVVIDETSPPPSPAPLPAAFPLFAAGLGVVGLLGRRTKRKNAAAAAAC